MSWQQTAYTALLLLSGMVTAMLGLYASRQRGVPGAGPLAITSFLIAGWSMANALEVVGGDLRTKLFWTNVQYLFIPTIPLGWFSTTLHFSGRQRWLAGPRLALLLVIPLITILLTWTSDRHELMRLDVVLDTAGSFPVVKKTYGPWFWVMVAYSYSLVLVSASLLYVLVVQNLRPYRTQPLVLLVGLFLPVAWNLLYISGRSPLSRVDGTPIAMGLSALIAAWGLFRYRLLDLVPVAYSQVIRSIGDGVIVVDTKGRVLDLNQAARFALGLKSSGEPGLQASQVFGDWPQLQQLCDGTAMHAELARRAIGAQFHYELDVSPLHTESGDVVGRVITVHDRTEHKQVGERLAEQQRIQAVIEERENVTRDIAELLHGRVQTRLLIAWHRLGDCQRALGDDYPRVLADLEEVKRMIDEVREGEIRQASHRLHPSILDVGLVPAVRSLLSGFEGQFEIAVHAAQDLAALDAPVGNQIPQPIRLAAYRVLEEALNNIARHAHANHVDVSLGLDVEGKLSLQVHDDGRGFDAALLKRGLGLSVIVGRAESVGGKAWTSSAVGQGTSVHALLPLHKP